MPAGRILPPAFGLQCPAFLYDAKREKNNCRWSSYLKNKKGLTRGTHIEADNKKFK
jgi:hypothetical protein